MLWVGSIRYVEWISRLRCMCVCVCVMISCDFQRIWRAGALFFYFLQYRRTQLNREGAAHCIMYLNICLYKNGQDWCRVLNYFLFCELTFEFLKYIQTIAFSFAGKIRGWSGLETGVSAGMLMLMDVLYRVHYRCSVLGLESEWLFVSSYNYPSVNNRRNLPDPQIETVNLLKTPATC